MEDIMQKIVALTKRRGFIYPGSEIYGGIGGFYDYGPLGVELKNNIKKLWWQEMVYKHEDIVGLDSAIITHPKVWEASGHVKSFTDPLIECRNCHKRFRADNLEKITEAQRNKVIKENKSSLEQIINVEGSLSKYTPDQLVTKNYIEKADKVCPECGYAINSEIDLPRQFNLLMKTYLGTVEGEKNATYLRGETCQGIYLNYKNVLDSMWLKIPFGIAQIGKAFRNEITPGNFTFRTREFEQMEMQWFIKADLKGSEKWFDYWRKERMNWYLNLGMKKLRFRDHKPNERAHYAKAATDIEYNSPFGWKEFEGIHNRSNWDLSRHSQYSGQDLSYVDQDTGEKDTPWIIETSAGADRSTLFFLIDAYYEEGEGKEKRVVLKLHPKLSPVKVAVFPLMANKDRLVTKAKEIYNNLKGDYLCIFDDIGNVGKRYRRQDEIGTPWCVTVDYQSLENNTVTVRHRDSMKQERIKIDVLKGYFAEKLK